WIREFHSFSAKYCTTIPNHVAQYSKRNYEDVTEIEEVFDGFRWGLAPFDAVFDNLRSTSHCAA
ncbi:MAG: hypothetical protein KDJ82_13460, partial [Rhodobacteraceae bacterium]|nr:hypothetical protein [Paracoccaceae bacterium]